MAIDKRTAWSGIFCDQIGQGFVYVRQSRWYEKQVQIVLKTNLLFRLY